MPSMPSDYLLSPKVSPLLSGDYLKTVGKFPGGEFSRKRAGTQPNDRVVLTNIDEDLRRKIKLGRCSKMGCQEYAVLYAEVRIPICICDLKERAMAVGYAGAIVGVTFRIDGALFRLPTVG